MSNRTDMRHYINQQYKWSKINCITLNTNGSEFKAKRNTAVKAKSKIQDNSKDKNNFSKAV